MTFDELFGDGETQAKPAVRASGSAILLAESFKNMREKFGADSLAVVDYFDPELRALALKNDLNKPAGLREFHGVGQQVPKHLLKPRRISIDGRGRNCQ